MSFSATELVPRNGADKETLACRHPLPDWPTENRRADLRGEAVSSGRKWGVYACIDEYPSPCAIPSNTITHGMYVKDPSEATWPKHRCVHRHMQDSRDRSMPHTSRNNGSHAWHETMPRHMCIHMSILHVSVHMSTSRPCAVCHALFFLAWSFR